MNLSAQIAKQLHDIHFGGNWTTVNLKDTLADVTWQEAIKQVYDFNSITALAYHTGYYVDALLTVLQGKPLQAKDIYSFDHPPINTKEDWENMQLQIWANAENAVSLIEQLPNQQFFDDFTAAQYGNYYRNIHGIIEHMHYHLGQIVLIKSILRHHI